MGISVICISGVMYGYVTAAKRAEWSAYSQAAEDIAIQRMEQTRSCAWTYGGVDMVITNNFTNLTQITNVLDVLSAGSNVVWATNFLSITTLSTNPPVKMIKVSCVWRFMNNKLFTNTVVTYRCPDN